MKKKIKKVNTHFSIVEDFSISEESLKLYKSYVSEDIRLLDSQTIKIHKVPSISQFSSCSIISLSKENGKILNQESSLKKRKSIANFNAHKSIVNLIEINENPIKKTSQETISVYLKYLSCGKYSFLLFFITHNVEFILFININL